MVVYNLIIIYNMKHKIYLDLEATTGRRPTQVLQISAVKADNNGNTIDTFNTLVRPLDTFGESIGTYARKILKMTFSDFKDAPYFEEAYLNFIMWSEDCEIYTWSNNDARLILKSLELVEPKCSLRRYISTNNVNIANHIDLQLIFMKKYKLGGQISLINAVKKLGLRPIGDWHNALDDAFNTYQIGNYLFIT